MQLLTLKQAIRIATITTPKCKDNEVYTESRYLNISAKL